jgi:hypothetical protein
VPRTKLLRLLNKVSCPFYAPRRDPEPPLDSLARSSTNACTRAPSRELEEVRRARFPVCEKCSPIRLTRRSCFQSPRLSRPVVTLYKPAKLLRANKNRCRTSAGKPSLRQVPKSKEWSCPRPRPLIPQLVARRRVALARRTEVVHGEHAPYSSKRTPPVPQRGHCILLPI